MLLCFWVYSKLGWWPSHGNNRSSSTQYVPWPHMCHGQGSRVFFGDGRPPTFNEGILISWGPINPYKHLGWVSFIPYYGEMSWELIGPIAQNQPSGMLNDLQRTLQRPPMVTSNLPRPIFYAHTWNAWLTTSLGHVWCDEILNRSVEMFYLCSTLSLLALWRFRAEMQLVPSESHLLTTNLEPLGGSSQLVSG